MDQHQSVLSDVFRSGMDENIKDNLSCFRVTKILQRNLQLYLSGKKKKLNEFDSICRD